MDPTWLRRQIGVVLQENLLFNRSIHDNIALADPAMPRGYVIHMAQLAGAHEFIVRLPQGYDTMIEERGANLSGGQRQKSRSHVRLPLIPASWSLMRQRAHLTMRANVLSMQICERSLRTARR